MGLVARISVGGKADQNIEDRSVTLQMFYVKGLLSFFHLCHLISMT